MARPIALIDCSNFYASCERLFQPEFRGLSIVVPSNNEGCVIARSNEAKALGIAVGGPCHLVKDRHAGAGIVVRSSNYTLYGDLSARFTTRWGDLLAVGGGPSGAASLDAPSART